MAESTGGDVQRYKYNGKELDRMHGLDWYDFGARHMDGARGQFTTMDPLCEKDYETSPYTYCGDNPMIRVDKDGRIWDTVLDVAFVAYDLVEAGTQYLRTGSVSNETKAALAADAMAAVIPGVTGAGVVARAGVKGIEASKKIRTASKIVKSYVHGNSKASTKAQHAYDIINTETKKIVKTGVSGGKILKNGKSARAESQVRKWNKEAGKDIYKSEITHKEPAGKGARERILEYEKDRANKLRDELDPEKHHTSGGAPQTYS